MMEGEIVKNISNLSFGHHTVSIKYNDYENPYSKTFDVMVGTPTKISAPQIKTVYNNAKNLIITLIDGDGKAISDKIISVIVNGKNYNLVTDKKGQVKLAVNLPAKSYTAKISFKEDETYISSSLSTKITVSKATPKIAVKKLTFKAKAKSKKVTLTLKDNKGRAMKGIKVTLKIKGKKYSAKTSKKGIATFKVKLTKKGTFKAIYNYAGNSNYKSVTKTSKITVKK